MLEVLIQSPATAERRAMSALHVWLPLALFCILWLDLCRLLSNQWETREQYAYGWFVPFFAAALLWRRWLDRPLVSQPSTLNPQSLLVRGLVVSGLVVLLPLRVIYEINPDWPLLSWLYTLIVVLVTLYAFHLAGPQSEVRGRWSVVSPWVRHFAFPVAFILIAVAWPWRLEKALTQGLMRVVAGLTVEILGWLDIPALQRGNLIELSAGSVGVSEACSGIRSFQSSLMAALLMGELYRMRLWRRGLLVACGLVLGFSFNVLRTLLLSWQANQHGMEALEKWHDPAGMTITIACFFCLWAIAALLCRKPDSTIRTPHSELGTSEAPHSELHTSERLHLAAPNLPTEGGSAPCRAEASERRAVRTSHFALRTSHSALRTYLLLAGCWTLLILAFTEAWYRAHDIKSTGVFYWSANFPTNSPEFAAIEINARTRRLLRHDVEDAAKWKEDDGTDWSGYFFRWNPKSVASIISARQHRPDICLPATGLRQVQDAGLDDFETGGLKLPFRKYVYDSNGHPLHVFFCQWEDGTEQQVGMWSSAKTDRVRAALIGRRHLGQQSLEFIVSGYASLADAEQALRKRLPGLIQVAKPGVGAALAIPGSPGPAAKPVL
jgi:exosortase